MFFMPERTDSKRIEATRSQAPSAAIIMLMLLTAGKQEDVFLFRTYYTIRGLSM